MVDRSGLKVTILQNLFYKYIYEHKDQLYKPMYTIEMENQGPEETSKKVLDRPNSCAATKLRRRRVRFHCAIQTFITYD